MDISTTRESPAAREAAHIWAQATAKRDDSLVSSADLQDAETLIDAVLESSERSFLVTVADEAEGEDGMLAFAAVEPGAGQPETTAELRYLGVAAGRWGEGWARRLLVALPGPLRENGFSEAVLWVYADNIRAIFVYEQMGWVSTGESRRHPQTNRVEEQYRLRLG